MEGQEDLGGGICSDYIYISIESKLLKGGYIRDYVREYCRLFKGDTRSLDYSSYIWY